MSYFGTTQPIRLTSEQRKRAKAADLIIPPQGFTNCGNCEYFVNGNYCNHPKIKQPVGETWCCIFWDAPRTRRVANLGR